MIALLYCGGLRISEALALYPKDLDHRAGTVTVMRGRAKKRRVVGLDPASFVLIERWLDRRARLGISSRHPLICTLRGGPIDPSCVRRLLPRLAERADIEERVHAHGLRHSHATELAAEGSPSNRATAG